MLLLVQYESKIYYHHVVFKSMIKIIIIIKHDVMMMMSHDAKHSYVHTTNNGSVNKCIYIMRARTRMLTT